MNREAPFVTIIIPTRPGPEEPQAVAAVRRLNHPQERLEILVARGTQPSVQRNAALQVARGELVYFLDDDALPHSDNLQLAASRFSDPAVVMVGGPNLCPPDAPELEQVFAVVLSSGLAFGPSRARYDAVGAVRATSEKELILCNLMARRAPLLEIGGFDEALYPNEENALMDALQKRGGQLLYDPRFIAHRRPRSTLRAFGKMLMTYGRGRAEQFRLHPTPGSALNLVPPMFCVYLLLVLAWGWKLPLLCWPLALYGLALLAQTAKSVPKHGMRRSVLALPLLLLTHVLYGIGFWRGLFTTLKASGEKRQTPPVVEHIEVG